MVDLERLRDNLKYIRRGRGLTFAKLAECQYVLEVLGDLPLSVAYERLAGMVRRLGEKADHLDRPRCVGRDSEAGRRYQ
jgi:hypothetical protein